MANVPTFDPELHQYSISISFWVDYLNSYLISNIASIGSTAEQIAVGD